MKDNSQNIKGALTGIKVIDISRLYPGPFCSMILADHGAEVIAIEDKKFQTDGLFLSNLYRNKKHICLNLKKKKGLEAFFKLIEHADVVIEGFRPGIATKLGVGYKDVCEVNPEIIYCSITGYGQKGPLKDRAGHDVNYLSIAGVLDLIGYEGMPPVIPGIQIADIVGALYATIGILMALWSRSITGKGQYIDISMSDCVLSLTSLLILFKRIKGEKLQRGNMLLSHGYACYNTYETKDGRAIALGALEPRFWKKICLYFGCEEFIPLQYNRKRRRELIEYFKERFKQKTLEEWKRELKEVDGCWSPVLTLDEALEHPLFKEREMSLLYPDESGQLTHTLGTPIKLSDTPGGIKSPPVNFGKDTESILKELGYREEEFEDIF